MFGGAYVVDDFSLVLKALFLIAGYVVILLSTTTWRRATTTRASTTSCCSRRVLGMVMMASTRDLISIFVALEFLSIPAYMLAAWRKRDLKSNEAGMKYFLLGVLRVGGDALRHVAAVRRQRHHPAGRDQAAPRRARRSTPIITLAIVFIVVGFAFKVSAVPFHTWAPDTYEGAPTPITAFLSVASKAAGFVALLQLVFVAFPAGKDVWQPLFWVLAAVVDDGRQPDRAAPDEHRPDAGLLVGGPGGLHPHAARRGRGGQRGRRGRPRPRSSRTCSCTRP